MFRYIYRNSKREASQELCLLVETLAVDSSSCGNDGNLQRKVSDLAWQGGGSRPGGAKDLNKARPEEYPYDQNPSFAKEYPVEYSASIYKNKS